MNQRTHFIHLLFTSIGLPIIIINRPCNAWTTVQNSR